MTMYAAFEIVESPLSEELEPLLRVTRRDLPADPVQRRMTAILAAVLLLVALFALAVPRSRFTEDRRPAPMAMPVANDDGRESSTAGGITGTMSPVFSAEVQHWRAQILAWSQEYGLDPNIVATIMQIESCGDPLALSGAGATGLFQVMPFHFEAGEDMFDPETNAARGLKFYVEQLRQTRGDVFLAFAGYNGGSAASSSGWDSWVHETQRYYVWSKGIYEDASAGLTASPTLARWNEAGGASLCRQAAERL